MSRAERTLGAVFDALASEGLVEPDWATRALAEADLRADQPWYVRAMVGFGAWLGSLLLIGAVVGASLAGGDGAFIGLGLLFLTLAVVVGRTTHSDFTRQAALASSLAGQALLAGGVTEASAGDEVLVFCSTLIVVNALLLAVFNDRTHRFLSVVFIVASVVAIVYAREAQVLLPFFGPLLAAGALALLRGEARIVVTGRDELATPVLAAMLFSALGCVMLSTLYVLPEIGREFTFYPRPWISTLAFGALLLLVERDVWAVALGPGERGRTWVAYALTVLVVLASLPAPGIVLALLVMAMGLVHGSPLYAGTGVAFLAVFLGTYFYGIDVPMMTKSISLVATGAALLFARRALLATPADPSVPAPAPAPAAATPSSGSGHA